MKKLFYLFMVAMCATMFSACSNDDKDPLKEEEEGKEGVITMVYEDERERRPWIGVETFNEGEIITIDWGDGTVEEFKSIKLPEGYENWDDYDVWPEFGEQTHYAISTDYSVEHEYSNSTPHIITIKGSIKGVTCDINITSLNVSKCTALRYLNCGYKNLTSLDVSKNTELTHLSCGYNSNLTSLDVSKNTKLTALYCGYNSNLTSLDVSKNTELTYLDCWGNNLTSLDVSKNTKLTWLSCYGNNLTSLDVSKNTALTDLDCGRNNLTSLDVSKNTELTVLYCGSNELTSAALNQIFRDLPQGKTWTNKYGDTEQSEIRIYGNPGTNTCDRSIAENKGWEVNTTL